MGSFSPFKSSEGPSWAGWVPTITGQLSFSLIGMGSAAPGCVTANVEFWDAAAGHPRRRVAVIKRRVTRDLPLTIYPIPEIFRSIASEFILLGETRPASRPVIHKGEIVPRDDEIGVLTGEVLVIPNQADLLGEEKALVRRIRRRIAAIGDAAPRAVIGADAVLSVNTEDWLHEANASGLTIARAHFELYRTGEFRLQQINGIPIAAEDSDDNQAEFDAILASQIYYFVKDIAHRHYHHRPSSDNLLPLTEIKDQDDLSWRRETLWSLARSVLEMRRSGKLPGHKSAVGVLAYAEAFQGLLARVERSSDDTGTFRLTDDIACYDFTHTRQSLEATIAEKGFIHSHWVGIHTFIIGTSLAFVALWLSAAQIRDLGCRTETDCPKIPLEMTYIIRWSLEQPHILAAALVILGAIYLEVSRRSLMVVTPLRVWGEFVGSWFDALGATISRWARKDHPTWGDQIGAVAAWVYIFFFVSAGLYSAGGLMRLWPVNPWVGVLWTASVILMVATPIVMRRGSK